MKYLDHAYDLLKEKLYSWFESAVAMLPNIAVAILILVIFIILARILRKFSDGIFNRFVGNATISRFLSQVLAFVIGLFGIIIVLDIINLDRTITSLLAGAGILGLAFSLAFQDVVSNFVSSVLVLTRKPYVIGDTIKTNEIFGKVEKINMRATMITVPEGQLVIIPNKKIMDSPLTNYTVYGKRRVDLEVGIHYRDDPDFALKVAAEAVKNSVDLLSSHPVDTYCTEFGDSSVNLTIRYWIKFETQKEFLDARSKGISAIHKAFKENGITIPFPIHTLEFDSTLRVDRPVTR